MSKWVFYDIMNELTGRKPGHMSSWGALEGADSLLGVRERWHTSFAFEYPRKMATDALLRESEGGEGDQTSDTTSKISTI